MVSNKGGAPNPAYAIRAAAREAQAKAAAAANQTAGDRFSKGATPTSNSGQGFGGGRITFDKAGNRLVNGKIVQFASRSSYNSFLAERGVSNKGTVTDQAKFAEADWSQIPGYESTSKPTASQIVANKPDYPNQNFGYSKSATVSPIIKENFTENPISADFGITEPKIRKQESSNYGGVETPQSKGKSFGWGWASKQTGQQQISRGSEAENLFVSKGAEKGKSVYPSFSNPAYYNPKPEAPYGGVETPQSKGLKYDTGTSLIRNSAFEEQTKASEASKASTIYPSKANVAFDFKPTPAKSNQSTVLITPTESKSNIGFTETQAKPSASDIASANKQRREYADYVGSFGQEGATIELFSGGKKVGEVSGKNAYRESVILSRNYPNGLEAKVVPSTTRSGRELTASLITSAKNVGAENINVIDTSKGKVIQTVPVSNASKELPNILNQYSNNPNISFSATSKQIKSPKETTSTPASVLALDISNINSKAFTGKYYNLDNEWAKFVKTKQEQSQLPLPEKSDKTEFGINIPTTAFYEAGQNVGSFITGSIKYTPTALAGLGTELYDLAKTGKSGAPPARPTTAKGLATVLAQGAFTTDLLSEKAVKNEERVSSFIHTNIGKPIQQTGIKTPQPVEHPKTIGALAGEVIGYGMMVPTEAVPFRIGRIPLKVKPETVSPAFPSPLGGERPMVTFSLVAGFGKTKTNAMGEVSYSGRELISKTASGYKVGQVKPENMLPEGYQISAKATRGEEFGTSTPYAVSKLSGTPFLDYAEKTGRALPGTTEMTSLLKETKALVNTSGEYKQQSPTLEISTEKVSPIVGKAVLESNARSSSILGKLNFLKGSGVQQGSGITKMFTAPKIAEKVFTEFPTQDIDIRVGSPSAGESGGIFGFLSERQAIAQASSAQSSIEKAQGIREQPGVGYHATGSLEEARSIIKEPSTEESNRGGFFVMNRANAVFGKFGNVLLRVKYNPKDVLKFSELPKSQQKTIRSRNFALFQENLINKGLEKNKNIVEKPYQKTKKGAGANPKYPVQEAIFVNPQSLKSIKSIEILPEIQITKAEKGKIVDVSTGEKLVEYTTSRSNENEVASALQPQGTILGKEINYKVYKSPIQESKYKGPHFGGQYQEETGLSQIMAFQTKETLAQQGASSEIISKIGGKFFVGSKAFGGAKEFARTFALFETKALELKSKPETYESGVKVEQNVSKLKEFYGNLYGVDFNKPIKGSTFEPPSSYWKGKSGIGKGANKSVQSLIGSSFTSKPSKNIGSSVFTSKGSQSKSSASSGRSILSGLSSKSSVSGKSGLSGLSDLSGKSKGSFLSGKSGKSGLSNLSGFSSISNISGFSVFSPSSKSGTSGSSTSSILSGLSGPSSFSGRSSFSSLFYSPPTKKTKLILPKFGDLPYKRAYKPNDRYTRIIKLNVINPFSSSLNIIERGSKIEI